MGKHPKRAKVLIVDDHPTVREGLAWRLSQEPDLEICGEASDMAEALRLVAETKPDVAIVDITLRTGSGIDLIKRVKDRDDHVRMLVWSMHGESLYAERALRAGALGYINKEQATEKVVEAIRRVREGKVWLSDAMAERILHRSVGGHTELGQSPSEILADRELEVFGLIGQGAKTSEIAARLHLSVKTIETYRDRIRQKLNLENGSQLAAQAAQWVAQNAVE